MSINFQDIYSKFIKACKDFSLVNDFFTQT